LIDGAALHLQGETRVVAMKNVDQRSSKSPRDLVQLKTESLMHA
jgi:hypothetical protein